MSSTHMKTKGIANRAAGKGRRVVEVAGGPCGSVSNTKFG